MLTVGEVARRAGLTVRTLHHYDETGLLHPSGRTAAGHRRYGDQDVLRLQQILFYRELGFPLEDISTLLDDPDADPVDHLRRQHELLRDRRRRLDELLAAVELNLEARTMGIDMDAHDMLEVFGEDYASKHEEYQAEAEDRWGHTDAWAQSRHRASSYGKDDWQQIKDEQDRANAAMVAALQADLPPDSTRAMDAAETMRRQIHDRFYDCSHEMHRNLGDMYVQDPRFTKTYEDLAPGLAQYVRDAIHANADRHEDTD